MVNDNIEKRGFISKEQLLAHVSEEEIYELVFGFRPVEFEYTTSPFRKDNNPGCWFSIDPGTGMLKFVDLGNYSIIKGIKMSHIDCFNAVQIYFNLSNFFQTLEFIKNKFIKGQNIDFNKKIDNSEIVFKKEKKKTFIHISPTVFTAKDGRFWEPYGITKENLIEDKVFSVNKFKIKGKKGEYFSRPNTNCYAFTDFKSRHKKLYLPYRKGKGKFITNCTENDVGGLDALPDFGDHLLISKSYKDKRVLINEKDVLSIWFQNEGVIPEYEILIDLCRRFKKITVLFDNDEAGIIASRKVVAHINTLYKNKASGISLPERLFKSRNIKDPADLRKTMGPKHLEAFLNENNLRNISV